LAWIVVKLPSWPESVDHQLALAYRAFAFDVRRPRLQPHDVALAKLELGGVLDRHYALVLADEAGQDIEQCRLARAGASGDDRVQPAGYGRLEEVFHRGRPRLAADQVVGTELLGAEAANRHRRAVERQRRDDRVHTRSVGEARVDHRARLVDAPADRADDTLDDLLQMPFVLERDFRGLEPAVPFDVDLIESIDQDVRDRRVCEQDLERSETEQLVQHVGDDALALVKAQRCPVAVEHAANQRPNLRLGVLALDPRQAIEVESVEQILMDAALEFLVGGVPGVGDGRSRFDDGGHGVH
jgi:Rad3-related DNA helicase